MFFERNKEQGQIQGIQNQGAITVAARTQPCANLGWHILILYVYSFRLHGCIWYLTFCTTALSKYQMCRTTEKGKPLCPSSPLLQLLILKCDSKLTAWWSRKKFMSKQSKHIYCFDINFFLFYFYFYFPYLPLES